MNVNPMKNKFKILVLLTVAVIISGCPVNNGDYDFEYNTIVGSTPVNLVELNTAHDDYNSDLPFIGHRQKIYFSSNRNSYGENFDFVVKNIDVSYHIKDDAVDFNMTINNDGEFEQKLFNLANTSSNQLGPLFCEGPKGTQYFFYASDDSGHFDIQLIHIPRLDWGTYNAQKRLFGPINLKGINSDADDYRPFPFKIGGKTVVIFSSNRTGGKGGFDLYAVRVDNLN
jgi:hypothetical protein